MLQQRGYYRKGIAQMEPLFQADLSYELEKNREAKRFLFDAMTIGEELLISGAEVSRVEDTISRICKAYGAERVDVLSITSSLVVTIMGNSFGVVTQTRRIKGMQYDLHRLELLNQLSRNICSNPLTTEEIEAELRRIEAETEYSFTSLILICAMVSASFSLFFGGTLRDAICSALIGMILKVTQTFLKRMEINALFNTFLCSVFGGVLAVLSVKAGFGQYLDKICIGDIMLLIPGLALTNSFRDMFSGDMISGLLRFSEALLIAVVLALGFVLVA